MKAKKNHGVRMPSESVHSKKAGKKASSIEASAYNKVDKKKDAKKASRLGVEKPEHYGPTRTRKKR